MRSITIGHSVITDNSPAWVIAEIGSNHGGHVQTACDMIRIAASCGAGAVKLQKRDNKTLYSQALLDQPYVNEHSYGATYGEHREALEFSRTEYVICQQEAQRANVECFATAFDEASVDFLLALNVPAIKIASGGLTDHALLRHVAAARVPIVLSTGGGTVKEIDQAVEIILAQHVQLALLHCTAAYPVRDYAEHNLRCLVTFQERYPQCVIGWSGHDSGIALAIMAYTLGARIIEMHFTLSRTNKGTDNAFSLEPAGLQKLTRDLRRAHAAYGDGIKRYYKSEIDPIAKMRRRVLADGTLRISGAKDEPTVDSVR